MAFRYRGSSHGPPPSAAVALAYIAMLVVGLPWMMAGICYLADVPAKWVWFFGLGGPALGVAFFGSFYLMTKRVEAKERALFEPPPSIPEDAPIISEPAAPLLVGPRKPSQQCVRCRRPLPEEANDARACTHGCGALLSSAAVEDVLARAHLDLGVVRELAKERGLEKHPCPSCASSMRETELRGLRADLCLSCGSMWLDEGERARLAREDAFA